MIKYRLIHVISGEFVEIKEDTFSSQAIENYTLLDRLLRISCGHYLGCPKNTGCPECPWVCKSKGNPLEYIIEELSDD